MPSPENNAKAARFLRVDAEWLATGEGQMTSERVWPFSILTPEHVRQLSPKALETIENFRDHGRVRLSIEDNIPQAKAELAALEEVGIHYDQVTQQLLDEGVQKFADSFHELFKGIEGKKQTILERIGTR